MNYEGGAGKIKNDDMEDGKFRHVPDSARTRSCIRVLKDGAAVYVCHADTEGLNFRGAFKDAGFKLAGCLIWCKDALVLGRSDYQWQHEPILYGWKPTGSHKWYGDRKSTTHLGVHARGSAHPGRAESSTGSGSGDQWFQIRGEKLTIEELETTVVKVPRPKKNEDHPTMKPVALIDKMLRNSTKKNDLVFDPFGGSGSTLISCEKLGRTAYLCELEPKFVTSSRSGGSRRRARKQRGRRANDSDSACRSRWRPRRRRDHPPFQKLPEVLVWGERFFGFHEELPGADGDPCARNTARCSRTGCLRRHEPGNRPCRPSTSPEVVSSALNLTEPRVQQLVKEGMPARGPRAIRSGEMHCLVHPVPAVRAREESGADADGGFVGEREERVRLLRADADLKEMELAKERSSARSDSGR